MAKNKKLKLFLVLFFFLFISINFTFAKRELEVPIPGLPVVLPTLPNYIRALFELSLIIVGLVAFFVIISGGFRYLTSGGSSAKMTDARDQIIAGILGLIIILSSYLILTTINPQLTILNLSGIKKPILPTLPIFSFGERPSTYQIIPVGTIIEGKILNKNECNIIDQKHCQKVLDKSQCQITEIEKCHNITCENPKNCELLKKISDLDNISYVTKKTKEYAEKLKNMSGELRDLINQCECKNSDKGNCISTPCYTTNPNTTPDTCVSHCKCTGDPCPNRDAIKEKQNEIRLFADAFEAFIKKGAKVEDFINDNEEDIMILPPGVKNLIYEMDYIENDNGGFKEIIENFENESKKTLIAERLMKECSSQPETYNNMITIEDISKEEKKEIVKENFCNDPNFQKEMDCEEEKAISPFADSATFYCFLE